jgi:ABC-2 type transport system ATP-binding protein
MAQIIARVAELKKKYGLIVALDGISFEVARGQIFGLLGPNGAGKTTAIKILTTLARPDGGTAEIAGADVLRDPDKVRRLIGYVPQELTVDPYLTAREHLRYYADLYHLPAALREKRAVELCALLDLTGHEDRRVRHFSGGMKKKLDLACGFIHRPPVILLDEPSLGLDVRARHEVWRYVSQLREDETTVILCTNYMDEAERLCDEVAIIDRGRIAALGRPAALRGELKRDVISVEVSPSNDHHEEKLAALENAVSDLAMVQGTAKDGTLLKIYVESNDIALPKILESATALSVPIHAVSYSRPGLDEVFLHYTGHSFEERNAPHG